MKNWCIIFENQLQFSNKIYLEENHRQLKGQINKKTLFQIQCHDIILKPLDKDFLWLGVRNRKFRTVSDPSGSSTKIS